VIDVYQFRRLVIRPALRALEPHVIYSLAAENLLLGTALSESRLVYLAQKGGGPAIGVYQVEPATHRDLWENFLAFKPDLASAVRALASQRWPGSAKHGVGDQCHAELATNLAFATAVARCVYRRSPKPMPMPNDAIGLASYHEQVYNTRLGAVGRTPQLENLPIFNKVISGGEWGPEL
jgi:hypothetical protein